MKKIFLPSNFTFEGVNIQDSIKTLQKFTKFRNSIIGVDFSALKNVRKCDMMVLLAQIEKSSMSCNNRIYRVGRFTTVKAIRDLLRKEPFIFHKNEKILSPNLSDSEKQKLINPVLIDALVNDLKRIGIKDYYYAFNVFLTELIGNAVEHGIEHKNINWWLTHEIDRVSKSIQYTFVDMGQGIIKSHQKAGLPLKYYFSGKQQIVKDAFSGVLGSSTKLSYRGRGLPQLAGMIDKGFVSNFVCITNEVSLAFKEGKVITKTNPDFVGTYYSWTVDQNNFQAWKMLQ